MSKICSDHLPVKEYKQEKINSFAQMRYAVDLVLLSINVYRPGIYCTTLPFEDKPVRSRQRLQMPSCVHDARRERFP